jgi:NAD(P)-dependent dehydrogenase (short-subunit alcohol dehydrogenase family)/acyl carrier protein
MLEPVAFSPSASLRHLRDRGVYLLTGGLGSIGLELAKRLATTCRARLVFVTHTSGAAIQTLREVENAGGEVLVVSADVGDFEQLERAVTAAEAQFGPVHGVFHLAGRTRHRSVPRLIEHLTPEDFEAQYRPKVSGFHALERVFARRPLDFGILFSSNASTFGGVGFGAYAAANAFLDHVVAQKANEAPLRWITTNWDAWAIPAHAGGDRIMSADEGLDALWTIVTSAAVPQVIVAYSSREKPVAPLVQAADDDITEFGRVAGRAVYVAPRTRLEQSIVQVWEEMLGTPGIGVDDDFLELGGDSLIALRVLARLQDLFHTQIPITALIRPNPTVAKLAIDIVAQLGKRVGADVLEQQLTRVECANEET